MKDHNALLRPYLESCSLMQVATISEGKPWICSVYFCFDDESNIYFLSQTHREHSKHIVKNGFVALAIVKQDQGFKDKKKGLQIFGKCSALKGKEVNVAISLYKSQIEGSGILMPPMFKIGPHRIWKVVPERIKIWDEEKYGGDGKDLVL